MSRFTGRANLLAITDSLGWNAGEGGIAGTDSYVTKAFQSAKGSTLTPWQGDPAAEYITPSAALLHNGNGGSFFGGVNNSDFANDHEMMRPVKYTTLGLGGGDTIYIALGTNDWPNDGATTGAEVWARAQAFIVGMVADHPGAKVIVATIPRRTNNPEMTARRADFNARLRAGYAALGVDAICDIEQAHPNFSTSTGDSTGEAYSDGVHFSNIGIAAAADAFKTVLGAL